jgi:hypothetical protein
MAPNATSTPILSKKRKIQADRKQERETISTAVKKQMKLGRDKDLGALYCNNVSLRKWDKIRRQQFGFYENNKPRTHTARLENYKFDRSQALALLGSEKNLGNRMTGKWTWLAGQVGMTDQNGRGHKNFNSGQVQVIVHFWNLYSY